MIVIVMGVSGSGKTTVGQLLAEQLGWRFLDADDYHPDVNIEKMASGIPLNDSDRLPWLETLSDLLADLHQRGDSAVLACSALKQPYRDVLNDCGAEPRWVYLKGDAALFHERMAQRTGHFMKADLLQSQFDILEEPKGALVIDASLPVAEQADVIAGMLS